MSFKNTLRKEINDKILRIDNHEELSLLIKERVISSNRWKNSESIFLYISFKGEVLTESIIEQCIKDHKKVYAPLISSKTMKFYRIDNIKKGELILNSYGILEPPKGLFEGIPDENSIMLIPGLGFTKNGDRLGRGGGYYDKYLQQHTKPYKLAITYSCQIVDYLETESWDQTMDGIITEHNEYYRGEYSGKN